MAAVRVENTALKDPRIEYLGTLLGTSRYDALGRMVALWDHCTEVYAETKVYGANPFVVKSIFGVNGIAHLVECGLAEDGDEWVLIRGLKGRVEWLEKKKRAGAKGGAASSSKRKAHSSTGAQANAKQTPSRTQANAKQNASKSNPLTLTLTPSLAKENIHTPAPDGADGRDSEPELFKLEASQRQPRRQPVTRGSSHDLDAIYWAYPKHIGKKPGLAKLSKLAMPEPLYQQILAAAKQMGRNWHKQDLQMCPSFSAWVNQERWEDEEQCRPSEPPRNNRFDSGPTAEDVAQRALKLEAMGL